MSQFLISLCGSWGWKRNHSFSFPGSLQCFTHLGSLTHSLLLLASLAGCVSPFPGNLQHVLAMLNVKREGTRGTSDIGAAASSLHQIQPDLLIDARLTERVYAPDRILEWTFPSSIRHRQGPLPLVFSVERHRRKIKTWAKLTGCRSHGLLRRLHLESASDLILWGWLRTGGFFWYADNRWQGMMQICVSEVVESYLMAGSNIRLVLI